MHCLALYAVVVHTNDLRLSRDHLPAHSLRPVGLRGGDVLFTLRTAGKYQAKRMPVLLETWMTRAAPGQVSQFTAGT